MGKKTECWEDTCNFHDNVDGSASFSPTSRLFIFDRFFHLLQILTCFCVYISSQGCPPPHPQPSTTTTTCPLPPYTTLHPGTIILDPTPTPLTLLLSAYPNLVFYLHLSVVYCVLIFFSFFFSSSSLFIKYKKSRIFHNLIF